MLIIFHSSVSFALLLIANCACGVLTALLLMLIDALYLLIVNLARSRFVAFGDYITSNINRIKSLLVVDLFICVISASFILFNCFIYNSGSFRIIAVPSFLVGLIIGKKLLNKTMQKLLNYVLFGLKWLLDIALFPISMLVSFIACRVHTVYINISKKRRAKIVSKYTAYCLSQLVEEAKYGLIDDYYKELENERTV